jgi:mRNA interferase RelE/StbE
VSWDYKFEEQAKRELRDLGPSAAAEILAYLDHRIKGATDPAQFGKPLRGSKHDLWRYRVLHYRLLCRLEKKVLIVVVVAIGRRSTVFDV